MTSKEDLKADLEAFIRGGGNIDDYEKMGELVAVYSCAEQQTSNKRPRYTSPDTKIPSRAHWCPPTPLRAKSSYPRLTVEKCAAAPFQIGEADATGMYYSSQPGSVCFTRSHHTLHLSYDTASRKRKDVSELMKAAKIELLTRQEEESQKRKRMQMEQNVLVMVRNRHYVRCKEITRLQRENIADGGLIDEMQETTTRAEQQYFKAEALSNEKKAEVAKLTEEDAFLNQWMVDLEFLKDGKEDLLKHVSSSRVRAFTTIILQDHLDDALLVYVDQIATLTVEQLNSVVAYLYLYGFDENHRAKQSCLPKRGSHCVRKPQLVEGLKGALNLQVRNRLSPIGENSGE